MAAEISPASSLAVTRAGASALSSLRRSTFSRGFQGSENTAVTDGVSPGRFADVRVTLNRPVANRVVAIGVAVGNGVTSGLRDLRTAVELAGHSSLVSTETNLLNANGTRISVVNIQAQAGILLDRIDRLVESAAFRGVNIISSNSPTIRLQTTRFGGGVNIQAQALDRAGLGLENLDLLSVGGIKQTLARIEEAIVRADQRVDRLESLQRGLSGASASGQFLSNALGGFGSATLDRGALVNLIA